MSNLIRKNAKTYHFLQLLIKDKSDFGIFPSDNPGEIWEHHLPQLSKKSVKDSATEQYWAESKFSSSGNYTQDNKNITLQPLD